MELIKKEIDIDNKCDREEYEFFYSEYFPEMFIPKITFGMHEGNTYQWIYNNDIYYFNWLMENVPKVKKYLKVVLKEYGKKKED